MANEKNLKRFGKEKPASSREEAVKNGREGGKKSGEVRAKAKTMRETIETLLSLPITNGKCTDIEDVKSIIEMSGKNVTVVEGIILAQIKKALKGDTSALVFLRDTVGERPTNDSGQNDETKLDRLLGEIKTECDT